MHECRQQMHQHKDARKHCKMNWIDSKNSQQKKLAYALPLDGAKVARVHVHQNETGEHEEQIDSAKPFIEERLQQRTTQLHADVGANRNQVVEEDPNRGQPSDACQRSIVGRQGHGLSHGDPEN